MKYSKIALCFLSLIFCISTNQMYSQSLSPQNRAKYKIWLTNYDDVDSKPGYLTDLKEEFIGFDNLDGSIPLQYHIDNVKLIKYRKESIKSSVFTGMAMGAIAGIAIGMSGGDGFLYDAETKALIVGAYGAGIGAGIGALAGLIKVKVPINGDRMKYLNSHKKLKKCILYK